MLFAPHSPSKAVCGFKIITVNQQEAGQVVYKTVCFS